jgi:hypothetical protein
MKGKSQAIVVYKGGAGPSRPPKKKKAAKKKRASAVKPTVEAFKAALMAPFSPQALGAKIPDMFAAPTVTKHLGFSIGVWSNVSGEADLVILPNLYAPVISPRSCMGAVSGPVTSWTTMDGVGQGSIYINDPASLAAQVSNYRIVGYGVRVYATSSLTATSGRALMATTAVSSWVNSKSAKIGGQATTSNNASASAANTLAAYGIPVSGWSVDLTSMPSMLNCVETSMVSLGNNPMTILPKVTSPEAFEFRQSSDSSIGFQINNQTSASYVSSGDASYLRVAGIEAIVLGFTGLPANTRVAQVELIYHIEGSPTYSVVSSDAPTNVSAPELLAKVVAQAASSPAFKQGAEMAGNFLVPGLGSAVRSLF